VERGRCELHKLEVRVAVKRYDEQRGTARDRGYDGVWERFRRWFLAHHPVCEDCEHLATEVHHKLKLAEHPELRLVESNCMALCKKDHSRRTAMGE
jgi:5-methylcytosine-specific restriction protein A